MGISFTFVVSSIFLAYIGYSLWTLVVMFYPPHCKGDANVCLLPYLAKNKDLQMNLYTSVKSKASANDLTLIWKYTNLSLLENYEKTVNVSIPLKTRRNGTLYLHVVVYPKKEQPFGHHSSVDGAPVTTYAIPQSVYFNLLGEKREQNMSSSDVKQVAHWRSRVTINIMEDEIAFNRREIPGEVFRYLKVGPDGKYLPVVFIDQLSFRTRDLVQINRSSDTLPLTISYGPISVGKLRMWVNMLESIKMLHNLGFTEKDTDEIKGIFADNSFYILMMTFVVAAFHLLFDFLAFKNEIIYWRNRDSMVGLSTKGVIWRCVSQAIIFLYLMDEETSLLVLIPSGISTVIEVWKVKKAFKVSIKWNGIKPSITLGTATDQEKETAAFDSQAMMYLSYILYPLCIGGAVYSLVYVEHKSWFSWAINSLVKGVYAFGFLFMLPQLFVNYKLKSVAHLPWRAFMYKAFNTFIDDIFAFIITMPAAHRLACFRDDVVFVVYLYQRWLYPVDKTRVNEYGQSFDEKTKEKPKKD